MKGKLNGIEYDFDLGSPIISITFQLNRCGWPSVGIWVVRETQFKNICHLSVLVLHMGQPWFRSLSIFTGSE